MSADASAPDLSRARHRRLGESIVASGLAALSTADPITISYATGVRNMNVYSMMGPFRFLLVVPQGPTRLEDQYLITDDGAERMSTAPLDAARCGG